MSTSKDDAALDAALARLANDTSDVSPDFARRLAQIPEQAPQRRTGLLARILKAFGGWGFAAPQLAGLAVAAYFGVATGNAQVADFSEQEVDIMVAQVFGTGEDMGWTQ